MLFAGAYLGYSALKQYRQQNTFFLMELNKTSFEVLQLSLVQLGWTVLKEKECYLQALTRGSNFTWGESITIVRVSGSILFNSRPFSRPYWNDRDSVNFWKLAELVESP
jgi:hypothetical protein